VISESGSQVTGETSIQVLVRLFSGARSISSASVQIHVVLPIQHGNTPGTKGGMVSNVPHVIVIGTSPGTVLQNKPGMLLLVVPLITSGYFGYGNWNGGGALGLVLVTLLIPRVAPGREPGGNPGTLRFEFFDDRRSGCYESDAGCFLEALFVLRVGNFLTSWTSCADARHDAL
jgi:hypothetical protein